MKKNTKIILIVAALIVVLLAITALVYAYLSDQGTKENNFKVGNNSVEVDEDFNPPPELEDGDNPFIKKVRAENTGNVPCYIRVFFDFSDSAVKENAEISAVDTTDPDASSWYSYEEYKEHLPTGWVYISLDEDPLLGGYFYYTAPLAVGESTSYLFQAVNARFENEYAVTDFEIIITTDSVQVTDKYGKEFEGDDAYKKAWIELLTQDEES